MSSSVSGSVASVAATAGGGKVPVTVIVPTKNEERNIADCLAHLTWADDVVLIDSCSTDRTAEIAREWGARVIEFRWNGRWPKKRNWALKQADLKHEWVLMVDADEWIVPELAAEIAEAIKTDRYVGYWINRKFMFMGRWLRHCGYYPSWNLRLLKRGSGEFEKLTDVEDTGSGDNEVHEHIVMHGPTGRLKHDMLHFAFPDIATFVEKHNRYSNWEAAVQLHGNTGHHKLIANKDLAKRRFLKELSRKVPFRPTLRFLYSYVWNLGVLDGTTGYIFCRLLATYEFLSVAKYKELRRQEQDRATGRTFTPVQAQVAAATSHPAAAGGQGS
jgi:glycosyltransferase involved in cell wall biosynthesis